MAASLLCPVQLKAGPLLLYISARLFTNPSFDVQRTHDQMSSEPGHLSCHTGQDVYSTHSAQSDSNSFFHFRNLDLRRPIMSQPRRDVIDLTEDTNSPPHPQTIPPAPLHEEVSTAANRPPRFDRNIIHIDDEEAEPVITRGASPEIEFLTSRPRSRSLSATRRLARRRPAITPGTIRRPQVAGRVPAGERNHNQPPGWADALQALHFPRTFRNDFAHGNEELVGWEGDLGHTFFRAPDINLNFAQAGFNYEQPTRVQPRLPTYESPPAAQTGFTRSPGEDEILVCPHCDDELGVGPDDVKRQVWVIKACGHVRTRSLLHLLWTNVYIRFTVANVRGIDRRSPARRQ